MSFDRDERTEVYGARRIFSTLGLVLGTALPAAILAGLGGEEVAGAEARSRGIAAFLLGGILLGTGWITFRATQGLDSPAPPNGHRAGVREILRDLARSVVARRGVLRNPVFVPLLVAFVIASMGRTLNASIALYFYEYRLELDESRSVGGILLPFFGCLLLSIPIWMTLARRFGKKWPAFVGVTGLGVLTVIIYPLMPPGALTLPLVAAIVGGFFGGAIVILDSLVADTVDHDELRTGRNREGLYFGVWQMSTKLSRALGLLLAGGLLGVIDFDADRAVQPPAVTDGLAVLFGPVVGSIFLAAAAVFAFLPLTDDRHRRIQGLLRRRRETRTRVRRDAEAGASARASASATSGSAARSFPGAPTVGFSGLVVVGVLLLPLDGATAVTWTPVDDVPRIEARDVGHTYPGEVRIEHEGETVTLRPTGVGLREATFMKVDVYTVASYLDASVPIPEGDPDEAGPALMELDAWKQLHITFCRDISEEQSLEGFQKSFEKSLGEEAAAAFDDVVADFLVWFEHDVVEGGTYTFTHVPGVGLRVEVGGELQGVIEDVDFARAYWSLYVGERPQSDDLREELLPE